ncbi:class I SAM-dependent methyltransferase [Methylobacterium oryzihabitans]|uniref:Class I SAM-dependent methyltransferase n=1 Tax=Methylobacterium oryzihabitans TaxID=2499852 RepID=A0A3S2V3T9_9HYPH|nr:class I SAM-dependent methyltransferase [Methylobacterium oryzihabitans]RVU14769.1 class I SAM-dependent methyltransferase [Methylobacterium oryzihabitans]
MQDRDVAECWEANADAWTRHVRAGFDIYRDALNTPAFLAMLPRVSGLSGLDIGCGEGANTRQIARLGAIMQGIDVAPTFVRHARTAEAAEPLGIVYQTADGTNLPFEENGFDFATAFMSLMDIPDQAKVLREAHRVVRRGGFLQFSILHPCFVPAYRKVLRDGDGKTRAVEVGGYFDRIDGRVDTWWFSTLSADAREKDAPFRIPRFHRTLSEWVKMICEAGWVIEQFAEPCADAELAEREPVVADTRVVPISLIIRARKPT